MRVELAWEFQSDPSAPAEGFVIYRKVPGGGYFEIGRTTSLSYFDDNAENGNTYNYMVKSYNAAGESINSPQVSIDVVLLVPPAPTNLKARLVN